VCIGNYTTNNVLYTHTHTYPQCPWRRRRRRCSKTVYKIIILTFFHRSLRGLVAVWLNGRRLAGIYVQRAGVSARGSRDSLSVQRLRPYPHTPTPTHSRANTYTRIYYYNNTPVLWTRNPIGITRACNFRVRLTLQISAVDQSLRTRDRPGDDVSSRFRRASSHSHVVPIPPLPDQINVLQKRGVYDHKFTYYNVGTVIINIQRSSCRVGFSRDINNIVS